MKYELRPDQPLLLQAAAVAHAGGDPRLRDAIRKLGEEPRSPGCVDDDLGYSRKSTRRNSILTAGARPGASGRLPLLGLVWVLGLGTGSAAADLFTGLATLRDTLRTWEARPPAPDTSAAAEFSLEELFPGSRITATEEGLRIVLPPLYGEQFPAALRAAGDASGWTFSVDMERRDSLLVLDGRVVEGLPADTALADLHQYARQALTALRTLGVPGGPSPPAWEDAAAPVEVKLVGRDVDTLTFSAAVWLRCLRRLARGAMVYAFLLEAEVGEGEVELSWAVFLRLPDASVQHLLHGRERLSPGPPLRLRGCAVRLVPGVRLDNLEDLFAPAGPERTPEQPWPLHLDRP